MCTFHFYIHLGSSQGVAAWVWLLAPSVSVYVCLSVCLFTFYRQNG